MFRTSDHSRHPVLSALAGPGGHVWSYVNLTHEKAWFFASYLVRKSDTSTWPETILLSSVDQVSELCRGFSDTIENTRLMLVSPVRVNQTDTWLMEPLKEVWCGRDPMYDDDVFVYKLVDGRQYLDSKRAVDASVLVGLNCKVCITG